MTYSAILLLSFIFIMIGDCYAFLRNIGFELNFGIIFSLNIISSACLMMLGLKYPFKGKTPKMGLALYTIFMAWAIISFFRGAISAKDYWDWKYLISDYLFSILVPLTVFVGINYEVTTKMFRFISKKLFLYGFVLVPISFAINFELYARLMMGVGLLVLFIPFFQLKWRVLISMVAIVSISMDFSYRANLLRILISMAILLAYYLRKYIKPRVLHYTSILLFCLPILLFYLGVSGAMNVFKVNPFEYQVQSGSSQINEQSDLSSDTRTFLYEEVFASMIIRNSSFIIGEGGGSGYQTEAFADSTLNSSGRFASEVGFLNTLLYSGLIGVFLYGAMLFSAAYYAINRSNNYISKMLGLFLTGHWLIFFLEDITKLDLNFFFIWLAIGLCLSNKFRSLKDFEIKQFCQFK
jgi:hypothetical protein